MFFNNYIEGISDCMEDIQHLITTFRRAIDTAKEGGEFNEDNLSGRFLPFSSSTTLEKIMGGKTYYISPMKMTVAFRELSRKEQ